MDQQIKAISAELFDRKKAIVFTGAGMSTESGIPDFRSPDGLWQKVDMRKVATPEAMYETPEMFSNFYRQLLRDLKGVHPNSGHERLADWEKRGLVQSVITQNIDRLHQLAGSQNVIELHGNLREIRCIKCSRKFSGEILETTFICSDCNGLLRPEIVLFGEPLPEKAFAYAEKLSRQASLFFVLGSSLEVAPANFMPQIAKAAGAVLVIINKTSTHLDEQADYVIHEGIGETLASINQYLREK